MATQEKVDVAIVGAGPSGAIFADVLARAGKKVVVLEFGPDWDYKQFVSSEIWGRRIKHAPPFQSTGRNPSGHGSNAGWGTGGAMIHFFANWPRMAPVDFKVKSQYGKGLDWPISYDDLLPWFDRAADDIGVSGNAQAERRWYPVGKDYPMPPLKSFKQGDIFNEAFAKHGYPLAPMPVAINSTEYKGRPACVNCGWCHVGCASGAHGTPLVSHLRDARARGAQVRPFSYVTRVLTNQSGDRVTGVEYYDAKREQHVQPAGVVVLAAYAAETPRIMFNSATDRHPKGLANKNELVGKYLMCHTAANVWALFDEDVQNYMGTQANQFMSYEHYDNKTRPSKGFGSIFLRTGAAMKPNVGLASARPDLFGAPLADFMKRAARGLTRIGIFGEQMPLLENRVELASDKDEFGLPIARITHSYDADAIGSWEYGREEAFAIAKAANPKEVWRGGGPGTAHLIGGTIMGTDASNSVTNSYGQTHELANLYIAGAGLFPTEGSVNPTNTIMAVTLRGAEHMAKNFSTIAS
ncbi:MAG: GMC family oxidoreductase [Xanthobacteraceae bacterium]|nr:GMC family oxidoreductase [Xanthobacteraceae bacterium]